MRFIDLWRGFRLRHSLGDAGVRTLARAARRRGIAREQLKSLLRLKDRQRRPALTLATMAEWTRMFAAAGAKGSVPIVSVTGTNGKTTTTRLIAHLVSAAGARVGMTCTDGVYLGGRKVHSGDCSNPESAGWVLLNPHVQAAVLETARGGILRKGLAFRHCDVAVVINLGVADHLGQAGIETTADMAAVKQTIVEAVRRNGTAVLNASDPFTAAMAEQVAGRVVYFAQSRDEAVLAAHCRRGQRAVSINDGMIVLIVGDREHRLMPLDRVPLTRAGRISFQIENVLASVAAGWSLSVPKETMRGVLETFAGDINQTPGRFNVLEAAGATVIVDYAHNVSALYAFVEGIELIPHLRRLLMFSVAGDRLDAVIREQGRIIGDAFDEIILFEDHLKRGRPDGQTMALLREGLATSRRVARVDETSSEAAALETLLSRVRCGDLAVLQPESVEAAIGSVRHYFGTELRAAC